MNLKKNVQENVKTIALSYEKFKKIRDSNDQFYQFLQAIGFSKTSPGSCPLGNDVKFKFLLEKDLEPI